MCNQKLSRILSDSLKKCICTNFDTSLNAKHSLKINTNFLFNKKIWIFLYKCIFLRDFFGWDKNEKCHKQTFCLNFLVGKYINNQINPHHVKYIIIKNGGFPNIDFGPHICYAYFRLCKVNF